MKHIFPFLIMMLTFSACDISDSDVTPDYSFVKVYDDVDNSIAYFPVDITLTNEENYIILSAITDNQNTNFPTIHVMKVNKNGDVVWEIKADPQWVNPVGDLLNINGKIKFVCMDDNSFKTKVISVNDNGDTGTLSEFGQSDNSYPLSAHYSDTNDEVTILSYDGIGQASIISGYNANMNQSFNEISTPINNDNSYLIFQHLKKQSHPFPFFIHEFKFNNSTQYAVSALSNWTLSLLFVSSSGLLQGRVNGFQDLGGISTLAHIKDNQFAVANSQYNSGDVYFSSSANIDISTESNVSEINTTQFPEIDVKLPVRVMTTSLKEKEFVIFVATTKTNQIAIYFYDVENQQLNNTLYLGHTNPIEVISIKKAIDDGLIILGKTWVAGRYQRILLHKVAYDKFNLS